ncbi:MAG TPA: type II toxin-antitoxin system Phd/YefM family antitoxin [Thermoanaerobaculia bacterium]
MKKIEISAASRPLSEYANELDDEIVILTSQDRPVAALIPLTDIDEESRALSTNEVFLDLVERAREEVRAGRTVPFEEVKRKLST